MDCFDPSHLYSVYLAPRGKDRMAALGSRISHQYLSPFDRLIGIIGQAGSGKSMLIKGMFPGLEMTNDDAGVNVRPLPLLGVFDDEEGFYTAHTYHVDVHFEGAFMQLYKLAEAIKTALAKGKRVVVEHFELIRPYLEQNAQLLIGIGEEVLITRPTVFGPEPADLAAIVGKSLPYRFMAHSAEDLCALYLHQSGITAFGHDDVRHGFILVFHEEPNIDLQEMEAFVLDKIKKDIPISFYDERHIAIGDQVIPCTGPRMHVKSTGAIGNFEIARRLVYDAENGRWLLIGVIGDKVQGQISDLNKIVVM